MFHLFKPKPNSPVDYSCLAVDFHSHLLPGIDDGAPDLESSLELILQLQQLGFKKIFTTPHVISDMYPNTRDGILAKRDEVLTFARERGVELPPFDAAAEYTLDESFVALMNKEPLLTLPGNRVLVEMSFFQPYPDLHKVLFDLQMKGYKPVLAHPERYRYYSSWEDFERVKQMGCAFQTNILSLSGYYHSAVQAAARTLLQHGLIDFLCTDLHHARQAENLRQALAHKSVAQAMQHDNIQNASL